MPTKKKQIFFETKNNKNKERQKEKFPL